MGEMIWGVRRRDAARHNESGWLIRPKTGDALLLSLSLGIFILFLFLFCLPPTPPPPLPVGVQARKKAWTLVMLTHPGQYGSISGRRLLHIR